MCSCDNFGSIMFSPSLKSLVWSMLHYWSVGRVQNATLSFYILCCHFFFFFIISFFIIFFFFFFFFWGSTRFPQQSINKSETGIGDQKLLVDVYVNSCPEKKRNIPLKMTVVVESYYRLKPSTLQKQESGIDVFPFSLLGIFRCFASVW